MASRCGTPIRYRPDVGWEYRCQDCADRGTGTIFWPLTDEFWNPRNMTRCLACHGARRRQWERTNYLRRSKRYERRMAYAAGYRHDARTVLRHASKLYYWTDPETQRAKARAYYAANRETILVKRREKYARKAA